MVVVHRLQLCVHTSIVFPGSAPVPGLDPALVAAAVASTVRIVLRSGYGAFGTGWVFTSPFQEQGLGAVLVSRHVVNSNALAQYVHFDLSQEAFVEPLGGHKLLTAPVPISTWMCTRGWAWVCSVLCVVCFVSP
jgi:hypothetical protein